MLPFIIMNLGSEMVYILHQRLKEQDLTNDRCSKILEEIIQNMFSQGVVKEIFRPQQMYSLKSTKQIFNKVAHSSNRKLEPAAMQTLFDLMIMAVKYQCKMIVQPEEIYFITLKHMSTMNQLITGCPNQAFIETIEKKFKEMCENFTAYDFMIVRQ